MTLPPHLRFRLLAVLAAAIFAAAPVFAAETAPDSTTAPAPAAEPDLEDSPLLAPEYKNEAQLVRFNPPLGVRLITKGGISTEIVSFVHDGKRWGGSVQVALPATDVAPDQFMKQSANELAKSFKGVQVLETKELTVSGLKAGRQMSIMEAEAADPSGGRGTKRETLVRQMLCIRLKPSQIPMVNDRGEPIRDPQGNIQIQFQNKYLVLHLFSPIASQKEATEVFDAMVARFRVLDPKEVEKRRRAAIKAGREWLAGKSAEDLKGKLTEKPQYFRMRVDGRDVGYTGFSEVLKERDGYKGILTVMSARTFPGPAGMNEYNAEAFWAFKKDNSKFDAETYYSYWANSTTNYYRNARNLEDKSWYTEIGTMSLDPTIHAREPMRDEKTGDVVKDKDGNILFKPRAAMPTPDNTDTVISITRTGDKRLEPTLSNKTFNWLVKPDSPAPLPKALENTWPRVVDLDKPASYAFVVFNGPAAKLGLRTLTVYGKQDLTIDGKTVSAYKLTDEIDPGVTTLYVDSSAKVLLMKTSDGTTLSATTEAEMLKMWGHRKEVSGK